MYLDGLVHNWAFDLQILIKKSAHHPKQAMTGVSMFSTRHKW
jgi:hypothetical protein